MGVPSTCSRRRKSPPAQKELFGYHTCKGKCAPVCGPKKCRNRGLSMGAPGRVGWAWLAARTGLWRGTGATAVGDPRWGSCSLTDCRTRKQLVPTLPPCRINAWRQSLSLLYAIKQFHSLISFSPNLQISVASICKQPDRSSLCELHLAHCEIRNRDRNFLQFAS